MSSGSGQAGWMTAGQRCTCMPLDERADAGYVRDFLVEIERDAEMWTVVYRCSGCGNYWLLTSSLVLIGRC